MTGKNNAIEKIKVFLGNRNVRSIPFIVIAGIIILLLAYRINYALDPDIKYSCQLIPADASFYIEARKPEKLYEMFTESDFGKSMAASDAWRKLALTPEFKKLVNILYFLQVRAGINIDYGQIPSFLGDSIGYAESPDGRQLLVFQMNLKSRFTMSLVEYFAAEDLPAQKTPPPPSAPKAQTEGEERTPVTPEQYESPYPEKRLTLSNLSVSHLKMGERDLYMAMMGDFFFLSDNLDFLKSSLYLGVDPSGASLPAGNRMTDIMKILESRDGIFIYQSVNHGPLSPVLTALTRGKGLAAILYCDKSRPLSGDIFTIGQDEKGQDQKTPQPAPLEPGWESRIPSDGMVSLVSNTVGINQAYLSVQKLDGEWSFLKDGLGEYFSAMDIRPENYFGDRNGFALCIRELRLNGGMAYPMFILGYESASTDDRFFRGIFKTGKQLSQGIQSGKKFLFRPAGPGQFYDPAFMSEGDSCVISSDRDTMNSVISASKKYRPVLGDLSTFDSLGTYARAPHHLIVQVDPLIQGLKNFYYYTAGKNTAYTSATIDRDVMPLAEPLKAYQVIHVAFGMESSPSGKLVITAR